MVRKAAGQDAVEKLRDDTIRRMLATPPQPHDKGKKAKAKSTRGRASRASARKP